MKMPKRSGDWPAGAPFQAERRSLFGLEVIVVPFVHCPRRARPGRILPPDPAWLDDRAPTTSAEWALRRAGDDRHVVTEVARPGEERPIRRRSPAPPSGQTPE